MSGPNFSYCFSCPGCGEPVALPRQSRLGWAGSAQFLHTAVWPILFLCPRFSFISEVSRSAVSLATEVPLGHARRTNSLWEIAGDCCLESCNKRHYVYTYSLNDANPNVILHSFLGIKPAIVCLGGHSAKFQSGRLNVNRMAMA